MLYIFQAYRLTFHNITSRAVSRMYDDVKALIVAAGDYLVIDRLALASEGQVKQGRNMRNRFQVIIADENQTLVRLFRGKQAAIDYARMLATCGS